MSPNKVFVHVSEDNFQTIKKHIESNFKIGAKASQVSVKESFEINTTEGKISIIYYKSGKLMLQSSPTNSVYSSVISVVAQIVSLAPEEYIETIPKEETELTSDYFIGCDEAGAGEAFGSMFLGCAMISKQNLANICAIIMGKNIRRLSRSEVNEVLNAIKTKYKFRIKVYTPSEIDVFSKNLLLDRGYIELITETIKGLANATIIIDDYGIRQEMKNFVNSIATGGFNVIVKNKADEEYTACKVGSLVARRSRLEEIETNNNKYLIIDETTKERTIPGSGAASNPDTEKYLIRYRKDNPSSQFPPFVRKKWSNVMKIDISNPRNVEGVYVSCEHCNNSIVLVHVRYDMKRETKLYCPDCSNLISVTQFRKYIHNNLITVDTSAIISRIISKDLKSTGYFLGNKFLLPTYVYDELDSKGPPLKKGGQSEISEIVDHKDNGIIEFEDIDTHLLAHGLSNDKKLLSVLDNRNCILLTKDMNMAAFAKVGHFVLLITGC